MYLVRFFLHLKFFQCLLSSFTMIRQALIENYFKLKGSAPSNPSLETKLIMSETSEKKTRKRNLSLVKPPTPSKTPKLSSKDKIRQALSDLGSEDDVFDTTPEIKVECIDLTQYSNESEEAKSDSSSQTISYNLTPENLPNNRYNKNSPQNESHLQTPQKSQQSVQIPQYVQSTSTLQNTPLSLRTPQNTPKSSQIPQKSSLASTSDQSSKSSQSREKFFSPSKKRAVVKREPATVKRHLSFESTSTLHLTPIENEEFAYACEGMDDKTIFILKMIKSYVEDYSLQNLLDEESHNLITKCFQLFKPGMRVVCRLYWRKEGWYKWDQINNISCDGKEPIDHPTLQEMIKSLVENGFIVQGDNHNMTFDDFKSVLNREELKQICKELKLKMSTKQDAIEALASFSRRSSNISTFFTGCTSNNSKRVLQIMSSKTGPCYKLSDLARNTFYKLYLITYLGMDYTIIREKKLELTLIYDKIKRETYPVDKAMILDNASVVFRTRDEFERYVTAHCIYEDFLVKTDVTEKCTIVKQVYNLYKSIGVDEMRCYNTLPPWLRRYTPANVYVKILEAGIQDLKKNKNSEHCLLALDILTTLVSQQSFRQHKKADWYAEKALILHSIFGHNDKAAEVLLEGFRSNLSEEAKDKMRPRARKIANQKNIELSAQLRMELLEYATKETILEKNLGGEHIYKQPMDRVGKRGKVKFETRTMGGRTVQDAEEYCITHYVCGGQFTDGEHWEGQIVTTIFFLLFWDIIYSKPPDAAVFLSHYQRFPLDLYCESFYSNRKARIDGWLGVIAHASEEKLLNMMDDTWSSRPEHELSGISRGIGWDNISMVASCLGPPAVAAICRRLAMNYRYAHSGFPDLTLWNKHTKKIKFVEVKTDTDKPSMKQIQWMNYLREHGVDTEFCYLGVHTSRQKCRTTAPAQVSQANQAISQL